MAFKVRNYTGLTIYVVLEKLEEKKYKLHISRKPITLKEVHMIIYSCSLTQSHELSIDNEKLGAGATAKLAIHDFESANLTRGTDENGNVIINVDLEN